jgi:hypothetical protein
MQRPAHRQHREHLVIVPLQPGNATVHQRNPPRRQDVLHGTPEIFLAHRSIHSRNDGAATATPHSRNTYRWITQSLA